MERSFEKAGRLPARGGSGAGKARFHRLGTAHPMAALSATAARP